MSNFGKLMARPFVPFTPGMWFAMLAALIYAGYGIYTLDATGFVDEEEDDEPLDVTDLDGPNQDFASEELAETSQKMKRKIVRGLTAHAKTQLKWEGNFCHRFCPATWDDVKDLSLSMALSLQSFIGGNDFRQECALRHTLTLHPRPWPRLARADAAPALTVANLPHVPRYHIVAPGHEARSRGSSSGE